MAKQLRNKKDLPNQKGFKFWAIVPDTKFGGFMVEQDEVYTNELGQHKTAHFSNMIGWMKETDTAEILNNLAIQY